MKKLANIYQKLKQQKWTHIVTPLFTIFILLLIIAIIYDINIKDFYVSYGVVLYGVALCPFFTCITFAIIILLKSLSFKFENIDKTNNKFLLHNPIYNFVWLIGMFTLLFDLYYFVFKILPEIF